MTTTSGPKAGARITWIQHSQTGTGWVAPFTRTGTVWSPAPINVGVTNAWWVHPDVPRASDIYHVIYVGRRSSAPWYGGPAKGEVYASDMAQDVTSILTVSAWKAAQAVKAANAATRAGYAPAA